MGLDAEELIIRPFQEVVDWGNNAVASAAGSADSDVELRARMTKAAQALVKEGKRALARLKPLWESQVEKYGSLFFDAILQNDSVNQKRQAIEELLYDFDDFAIPDTFSPERFIELQAATKAFAMDVIDSIKRMKLEVPVRAIPSATPLAQTGPLPLRRHQSLLTDNGPKEFPPLPPLPPYRPRIPRPLLDGSQRALTRSPVQIVPRPSPHSSDSEALPLRGNIKARRCQSPTEVGAAAAPKPPIRESSMVRDGRFPVMAFQQLRGEADGMDDGGHYLPRLNHPTDQRPNSRQQLVLDGPWNASMVIQPKNGSSTGICPVMPSHIALCENLDRSRTGGLTVNPATLRERTSTSRSPNGHLPGLPSPRTAWTKTDRGSNRARPATASIQMSSSEETFTSVQDMPYPSRLSSLTAASSIHSTAPSSVFDHSHLPSLNTTNNRASILTANCHGNFTSEALQSPQISPTARPEIPIGGWRAEPDFGPSTNEAFEAFKPAPPTAAPSSTQSNSVQATVRSGPVAPSPSGMTTMLSSPAPPAAGMDNCLLLMEEMLAESRIGPRLAEDDAPHPEPVKPIDCSFGPTSTFNQMGGFCSGATSFRIDGWRKLKQTAGYMNEGGVAGRQRMDFEVAILEIQTTQEPMMRCQSCKYGHEKRDVDLDMEKKARATTKIHGVNYRLRLLYKSHVNQNATLQRQLTACYACPFCVHTDITVRDCDATVFRSADDFIQHLARHPQPLPAVEGLTVVYGAASPDDPHAQDFDLHFPESPLPVPMPENVVRSARAVASEDHFQAFATGKLRKPPSRYDGDMLQFLAGSRIVGVVFPERWEGKWCLGRHDGGFGAFPAKSVDLRPPVLEEIPLETSQSGMSVTAKWKWKPRRSSDSTGRSVWLEFRKGDTISNVRCLYADHWCWAGTDKTGRFGVFPQSHLDLETLRRDEAMSVKEKKKSKTRGLFNRRPTSGSGASSHNKLTLTTSSLS